MQKQQRVLLNMLAPLRLCSLTHNLLSLSHTHSQSCQDWKRASNTVDVSAVGRPGEVRKWVESEQASERADGVPGLSMQQHAGRPVQRGLADCGFRTAGGV